MEIATYLTEVLGVKSTFGGVPKVHNQAALGGLEWIVVDQRTNDNEALIAKIQVSLKVSSPITIKWIAAEDFNQSESRFAQTVILTNSPTTSYGETSTGGFVVPSPSMMSEGVEQEVIESKKLCWNLLKQWKAQNEGV